MIIWQQLLTTELPSLLFAIHLLVYKNGIFYEKKKEKKSKRYFLAYIGVTGRGRGIVFVYEVKKVLEQNKKERHLRGGEATKNKYKHVDLLK